MKILALCKLAVGILCCFFTINTLSGCASTESYQSNKAAFIETEHELLSVATPGFGYLMTGFQYLECKKENYNAQYALEYPEPTADKRSLRSTRACGLQPEPGFYQKGLLNDSESIRTPASSNKDP